MKREEIIELVHGTADAAYVLDPRGIIVAWNKPAEVLFEVSAKDAIGQHCSDVLHGTDECGRTCSADCVVKEHAFHRDPLSSYDIEVDTAGGRKWCDMSVIMAGKHGTAAGYTFHVARSADLRKRMEQLLRACHHRNNHTFSKLGRTRFRKAIDHPDDRSLETRTRSAAKAR